MKKLIILLITCVVFTGLCKAQEGFRLVGQVDGIRTGKLFLLSEGGKTQDTLGITSIDNGIFEFVGRVNGVMPAHIVMAGKPGSVFVMLENTTIFVKMAANGEVSVEAGEEHKLYKQFTELNQILVDAQAWFGQQAETAARQGRENEIAGLQKQFEKVVKETNDKIEALMKENPDHYATAYSLFRTLMQLPPEVVGERYEWLGDKGKGTPYGRSIADYLQARKQVEVGSVAPDFKVKTPEGDMLSLHGVKAKLKLLDFWASWCRPCRQVNTHLLDLYRKYQPSGLQIVSISMDSNEAAWRRAIGEDGLIWFNGSDLQGEFSPLFTLYFVSALPHTLLLDEENRIIAKDLDIVALRKKVGDLLKKKK